MIKNTKKIIYVAVITGLLSSVAYSEVGRDSDNKVSFGNFPELKQEIVNKGLQEVLLQERENQLSRCEVGKPCSILVRAVVSVVPISTTIYTGSSYWYSVLLDSNEYFLLQIFMEFEDSDLDLRNINYTYVVRDGLSEYHLPPSTKGQFVCTVNVKGESKTYWMGPARAHNFKTFATRDDFEPWPFSNLIADLGHNLEDLEVNLNSQNQLVIRYWNYCPWSNCPNEMPESKLFTSTNDKIEIHEKGSFNSFKCEILK